MAEPLLSLSPAERPIRRRKRRDPKPRFKAPVAAQLDPIRGCPELQVPSEHLARKVRQLVNELDLSVLEQSYSSLGRHGYTPRSVLSVLVYASMVGIHESTKIAESLKTDAALRLVSDGHAISAPTLRRFRQKAGTFLALAIEQTVALACREGRVDIEDLAVDSVRLRANASTKAARTLSRSTKRLEELQAIDASKLSNENRRVHEEKLRKHCDAVERCVREGRSNFVTTNEAAGLLKFPDGGSAPGHRVTVVGAGVKTRLVIAVLIDADGTDFGKLQGAVEAARDILLRAGAPPGAKLQVAADAGYHSEADLVFARDNRAWVDVLIPERASGGHAGGATGFFGHERFTISDDLVATCPAGTTMLGPYKDGASRTRWNGRDCKACSLRPQCTDGKQRVLTLHMAMREARREMSTRMAQPGARQRYNRRMATIEPIFSSVEHGMGFRRLTTRTPKTVVAEILLKLLAHNLIRLAAARGRLRVLMLAIEF